MACAGIQVGLSLELSCDKRLSHNAASASPQLLINDLECELDTGALVASLSEGLTCRGCGQSCNQQLGPIGSKNSDQELL